MSILGTVGIADKGDYNANTTYVEGNFVYYGGSTWVALKNNITGITPEEGENWKYLARGFGSDSLSQIEGTDTSGVLGTAGTIVVSQALIDAIADKVMTKLIPYANIANNFLSTDPKTVLSGPMGKSLKELYDQLNSNLVNTNNNIGSLVAHAPAITDCNTSLKSYGVSIVRWDENTLNTPYKQAGSGTNQGYILDFSIDVTYRTQIAIRAGLALISVRAGTSAGWSNWNDL